jgi:hypothetical protein
MAFTPPPYTPLRVDNTNNGAAAPPFFSRGVANHPPIKFGSNFYYFLYDDFTGFFEVMKSVDDLTTWTVVTTSGGVVSNGWNFFANATKMYVAYINNSAGAKITFLSFDFATETLSAPYGAVAGQPGITPEGFFVRSSDGVHIVINTNQPAALISPGMWLYDPGSNTWNGANPFLLGGNAPGGANFVSAGIRGVIESTGALHILYQYAIGAGPQHLVWQRVETDNTLTAFHDFGADPPGGHHDDFMLILWEPLQKIIISYVDNITGNWWIIYGTDLAVPVWTGLTAEDSQHFFGVPVLNIINGTLNAVAFDVTQNLIWIYQTTNLNQPNTGWSPLAVLFDGSQTTVVGWSQFGLWSPTIVAGSPLFLFFGNPDPTNTFNLEWHFVAGNAPIPPPNPPGTTIVSGPMIAGVPIGGIFTLPDPQIQCDIDGRKRCIIDPRKR